MSRILFILIFLALTGCGNSNPPVERSAKERIYTVEEFIAQPTLRKQFLAVCGNNPGQLGESPNCINVFQAEHIASIGTTIPSFTK